MQNAYTREADMAIEQDEYGFYYNVTNRYMQWGADTAYYPDGGFYLPTNQYMQHNAEMVYTYLSEGEDAWSFNAIMAVLGNMCKESAINPAQTQQGKDIGGRYGGYGLVMWTPQYKYRDWARQHNVSVNLGYYQLIYLDTMGSEWIAKPAYNNMTWEEFKHGQHSVDYLTEAFFDCYERGNPRTASMEYRKYCASYYADYFGGYVPPEPPSPPTPPPYKDQHKMPVWMMTRRHWWLQ